MFVELRWLRVCSLGGISIETRLQYRERAVEFFMHHNEPMPPDGWFPWQDVPTVDE